MVAGVSLVERTLTAIPGIERMQLVQDSLSLLQVNVVKEKSYTLESEASLIKELSHVFGDGVAIEVRYVPELDKTGRGKYRFAICNV